MKNSDIADLIAEHQRQIGEMQELYQQEIQRLRGEFESVARRMTEQAEPPKREQPQMVWSNDMLVMNKAAVDVLNQQLSAIGAVLSEVAQSLPKDKP